MTFSAGNLWKGITGGKMDGECPLGSHLHSPKGRSAKFRESRQHSGQERQEGNLVCYHVWCIIVNLFKCLCSPDPGLTVIISSTLGRAFSASPGSRCSITNGLQEPNSSRLRPSWWLLQASDSTLHRNQAEQPWELSVVLAEDRGHDADQVQRPGPG